MTALVRSMSPRLAVAATAAEIDRDVNSALHELYATSVHISLLSMLTLIAFEFALGNLLPRVSYLTRVDIFALGCLILVFLALVETVAGGVLAGKERHAFAQGLHRGSRWGFPICFALLLTFAFFI